MYTVDVKLLKKQIDHVNEVLFEHEATNTPEQNSLQEGFYTFLAQLEYQLRVKGFVDLRDETYTS